MTLDTTTQILSEEAKDLRRRSTLMNRLSVNKKSSEDSIMMALQNFEGRQEKSLEENELLTNISNKSPEEFNPEK